GSHGDGRKNGRGCTSDAVPRPKEQFPVIIKVTLGTISLVIYKKIYTGIRDLRSCNSP
ncbi:hypothetical protein MKW92_020141, partial [Papaver armeniacum]